MGEFSFTVSIVVRLSYTRECLVLHILQYLSVREVSPTLDNNNAWPILQFSPLFKQFSVEFICKGDLPTFYSQMDNLLNASLVFYDKGCLAINYKEGDCGL